MLYSRDYYNLFVSHLRTNSVIHFDIESNYENHFLKNIRNNDDYNQNNEDGSDGEWDGESEDSSDDSDNYDDTHQGENHVEEEEEEELEREQVYSRKYELELANPFPVMVPIDCLLTKKKLVTPAKSVFCQHFQCFELRVFIFFIYIFIFYLNLTNIFFIKKKTIIIIIIKGFHKKLMSYRMLGMPSLWY